MNLALISTALLAGWCGTPYPGRFRFPLPWFDKIPGDFLICPRCGRLLGALGGLFFYGAVALFMKEELNLTNVLIGGFMGGRLINEITAIFSNPSQNLKP